MKHLAYLNKYLFKYRWHLIPGFVFVVVSNYFGVIPAQVIRIAFDLVRENISVYRLFNGFERQELVYQLFGYSLLLFGLIVLVLALIRGLFLFLMRQTIILTSRRIEYDLKNEIYAHYQRLDMAFFRRNNTGDLMNRVTEDVSRVRAYLGPAIMYAINTIVLSIMVITAMFSVNTRLALYALIPIPILSVIILFVNKIINKRSERIQEKLSALSSFVQETFSGIRVIKTYNREHAKMANFSAESGHYKEASLSLVRAQAIFFPLILLLIGLSTVITIYIGGSEVMRGSITSGNIAEFIVYVNQLTFPAMSLAWVTSLVQRAAASQKRINEFLNTPSTIQSASVQTVFTGNISFKNVNFTYPDTGITALKDISFDIAPGKITAIIGRTGAGKSTIARLLMRMYDAQSGEILVDDTPINRLNLLSYRSAIGFVPQEVFLFSDTIAKNIAFGMDELNMPLVKEAAKKAAVYDNIINFEKGFDTFIGERGITLSGGQKQRISIARAIAIDPKILIFDDCLSAIDTKTEELILQNLREIMHEKSAIFIAHRISTIKNADHILVMEQGEIVEQGKHEALLALRGSYYELYEKQLLEEENVG
ncbi:ABC transporter ATP-binding protein [Olivibacter sp. SDN3]|uniref:ABC transporter ATP-binding protein n=1 Tax=Olivibacter sp. SDN3 TaxID=2764720 RepID=UPI001651872E|nr:ABC transporter ATP-binding protein [Olivibacter sp. SDN3]QNL49526.1 ABC transporter ATP-binding protein [Olivibacter sp. SDN3]